MGPVIAMMYLSVSGDILKSILTELSPSENPGLGGSERESDWPKATQLSVSEAEVTLLLWLHPASFFGVMGLREAPSWQVSGCLHFDVMIVLAHPWKRGPPRSPASGLQPAGAQLSGPGTPSGNFSPGSALALWALPTLFGEIVLSMLGGPS